MDSQRKPRVLLADDEAHIRALMKAVLTGMNCEIVGEAVNGEEAVDLFKRETPDLLLLDINMPRKDGIDALKEIVGDFPSAFVIMLTSVADIQSVEECIALGAANYILKDTPIGEIKDIIRETWQGFRERENKGKSNG